MSATHATPSAGPEPTAIIPNRVLVLSTRDQIVLRDAVDEHDRTGSTQLADRIAYGEVYDNSLDELVRLEQEKRALKKREKAINARLAVVEADVLEDMDEQGVSGFKHDATRASVSRSSLLWAKVEKAGDKVTDAEKQAAGRALKDAGLGDFVGESFNTTSVSAYFRELWNQRLAEQDELPEDQRSVLDPNELLPEPMRPFFRLDNTPTTSVRIPAGA